MWSPTCTRAPSVSFAEESAVLPCDGILQQAVHAVATGPIVEPPPETMPVILPPLEPPPVDLLSILGCLPAKDHAAFATQFIAEAMESRRVGGQVHPSSGVAGVASRLVVPQHRPSYSPPLHRPSTVEYAVPMEKARPKPQAYFPQGSIFDPGIMVRPSSPVTPFEFPFDLPRDYTPSCFDDKASQYRPMDSVTGVVGLPRV
jgi:hypothetical protein